MKRTLVKQIIDQGIYIRGQVKKQQVVDGVDLFGRSYFIVITKGKNHNRILFEDEYGSSFALQPI